jgi:hypothetical protein
MSEIGNAAASSPNKRTCILVLGMHRSGTSAITRVLSLLGVALPKNVTGAAPWNEAGHWEPSPLVQLHDEMLLEMGSRWDDWRPFAPDVLDPSRLQYFRDGAARIVADEYGDAPLFVLKDPRVCRFEPHLRSILESMNIEVLYVQSCRDPASVSRSLAKREEMSADFAFLVWLRNVLDAEFETRVSRRAFISYEDLLDDWRAAVENITRHLKLAWPRSLEAAEGDISRDLRPELRHYLPGDRAQRESSAFRRWVEPVHGALRELCALPDCAHAQALLDRIRQDYNDQTERFGFSLALLYRREAFFFKAIQDHVHIIEARDRDIENLTIALQSALGTKP